MTTFRSSLILLGLFLSACEATAPEPPPTLSAEQQVIRMQLCMGEIEKWRAKGVWIHGGVEPAVNRDAWGDLEGGDQQKIADIAACIASGGAFQRRKVQIVSEGFKVPIEEIEFENMLFVDSFRPQAS